MNKTPNHPDRPEDYAAPPGDPETQPGVQPEAELDAKSQAELEARYTYQIMVERPVPYAPRRVVSLVPSITESLFDLNLGKRLIGVTEWCTRPADGVARLPKLGGTKNPDIDRIIALQPDLVMMNSEENRKADADTLRAAGIPLWVSEPRTILGAIEMLWQIMDVFEEASMTYRVRSIHIIYEQTRRLVDENSDRPLVRTFCPIWRDPWMTGNADTYIHDVLYTCGAINVFADRERQFPLAADLGAAQPLAADDPRLAGRDTRYPRITIEEIVAAQPELVLLPDEPYAFGEADVADVSRLLAETPAGREGHVYLIDGSFLTWHGTRLAYALRDLPPLVSSVRPA